MPKIRVDGIEYEAAQEVINFLGKETARADSATAALTGEKSEHEKTRGERDSHKARADALEAEKAKVPTLVAAGVKARLELERKAATVLDEKDRDVSALTDEDIKKKVVLKAQPDAKLDGVSAEYLQARFDSAVEAKAAEGIQRQREASGGVPHTDETGTNEQPDVAGAEKRYQSGVKEAWKGTKKTDGCGTGSKTKEDKVPGSLSRKE